MKPKYIYTVAVDCLHMSNQFKMALPCPPEQTRSVDLELQDCIFTGKLKNVLLDSHIEVQDHYRTTMLHFPELSLHSTTEFVRALNSKLNQHNASVNQNSVTKRVSISFNNLLHPSLTLSRGLASILGMSPNVYSYSEGPLNLGRAYERLLLVCPQIEGNTYINGNLSSVLGILKPENLTNGMVKFKLIKSFSSELSSKTSRYITLQLVPAICPSLPLPYDASGEILVKYMPNSE